MLPTDCHGSKNDQTCMNTTSYINADMHCLSCRLAIKSRNTLNNPEKDCSSIVNSVPALRYHGCCFFLVGDGALVPSGCDGVGATVANILLQVVSQSSGHHQVRRDGRGCTGASHGGLPAQAPLPWLLCPSKSLSSLIPPLLLKFDYTSTPIVHSSACNTAVKMV